MHPCSRASAAPVENINSPKPQRRREHHTLQRKSSTVVARVWKLLGLIPDLPCNEANCILSGESVLWWYRINNIPHGDTSSEVILNIYSVVVSYKTQESKHEGCWLLPNQQALQLYDQPSTLPANIPSFCPHRASVPLAASTAVRLPLSTRAVLIELCSVSPGGC